MLHGAFIQRLHPQIRNNGFYFGLHLIIYLMGSFLYGCGSDLHLTTEYLAVSTETRIQYFITPSVIIMSCGAFGWLMAKGDWLYQKFPRIISSISNASFGIYLSHMIMLKLFKYYIDHRRLAYEILPHSTLYKPVTSTLLLLLCWGFVICAKKAPLLHYMV